MHIEVVKREKVEVTALKVSAKIRYWEDSTINGVEDVDGSLVPCRSGDLWCPNIDLETGVITNWKKGVAANISYKVCDCGRYSLLDPCGEEICEIDGYVPSIMCPKENGYGDYILMDIDEDGKIANWKADLEAFQDELNER